MDITTRHAEELDAHWINRIILLILKDVDTLPAGMDMNWIILRDVDTLLKRRVIQNNGTGRQTDWDEVDSGFLVTRYLQWKEQ